MVDLNKEIAEIRKLKNGLFGRDFLLTWDKSLDELRIILKTANILKALYHDNASCRLFDSGLAVSHFRDKSTRTRFSFASAANLLGLAVQDLDEGKSQITHGETVRETASMVSFLTEVIGIRDDIFLGAGHTYMLEVGIALDNGYKEGVLPQRPTIVNLQCDVDHPSQSMADLLQLEHYFEGLDNLRGKKIAMSWAYSPSYGKPLSVPQGVIGLMTRFGMNVVLAHPEGYNVVPEVLDLAALEANKNGGSFHLAGSMEEAFQDADVVYPKSWAPYQVMERRTALLRQNDAAGLKDLEKECLANNARFKHWECTEARMKLTRNGKALYMHCLPADISSVSCAQGEVQKSVFDRYRIETYREAGFKPFIIAAMILAGRFDDPAVVLKGLAAKKEKRRRLRLEHLSG
ncbi:MAG: knotted carbamoyltransferase YgeW [Acidobacteriia bacterium]|nr:knotted carbamoyltransferase YgeW [Terriglobia bacterium]